MSGLPSEIDDLLAVAAVTSCDPGEAVDGELRTRIVHLLAERETLKRSYAQAAIDAIEEHDKRLVQQQQNMARLEAVMKLAAEGIITINEQGTIESFNDAASRVFGYAPHEVVGQSVTLLVPAVLRPGDPTPLIGCLAEADRSGGGSARELIGQRKDGTEFPLEIALSEVPLDSGRVFMGILRDTTERRRLERQLVQSQKMESVGQLAAGIAHEINTPTQYVGDNLHFLDDAFRALSGVLAACCQLCQAAATGAGLQEWVGNLVAAAQQADIEYLLDEVPRAIGQSLDGVERVTKIVRSMKDFSHPGGETMQAVDLNRALESTLTVCRNEWKYVADAVTDFDPELPLVTCLPGECNQVFLNLIINAAHAISDQLARTAAEKGTIRVSTRRQGRWAEIHISDTGTGIPEEYHRKIFDPFFTTKEVGRGTGQGLAIARSVITQKHKGTIDLESEVGRGTTFIVRLPIAEESGPEGAP